MNPEPDSDLFDYLRAMAPLFLTGLLAIGLLAVVELCL